MQRTLHRVAAGHRHLPQLAGTPSFCCRHQRARRGRLLQPLSSEQHRVLRRRGLSAAGVGQQRSVAERLVVPLCTPVYPFGRPHRPAQSEVKGSPLRDQRLMAVTVSTLTVATFLISLTMYAGSSSRLESLGRVHRLTGLTLVCVRSRSS